jgi:hypothetical protein
MVPYSVEGTFMGLIADRGMAPSAFEETSAFVGTDLAR